MVYSKHCFCCKLLTSQNSSHLSLLANDEVNDWKYLSEEFKEHENCVELITNIERLLEIVKVTKNVFL